MRRLVVEGYYGMGNAGDDAFCVVTAALAAARWEVEQLSFVAPAAGLPVLPEAGGTRVRGIFPQPVRVRGQARAATLAAKLRAGDVAHVGGSVFSSPTGRQRDELRLARLGLLRLHAVGVSVGPFPDDGAARRTAGLLRRFRTVHLRDTASAERLAAVAPDLAPRVGFDVAVLLPELDFCGSAVATARGGEARTTPRIGISVCHDATLRGAPAASEARREEAVISTLRALASRRPVRYRFVVLNSHPQWGDLALTQRTAAALADHAAVEIVPYDGDVRQPLAALAGCDAVLGTRLHSAIFAYACGVPFAIIAYRPKGADFAREAGLPERFVFPAEGPDPETGVTAITELLDDGESVLGSLLPLSTARARAGTAFSPLT